MARNEQRWKLSDITPYGGRCWADEPTIQRNMERIRRGDRSRIVIDHEGEILLGHVTYEAAQRLGFVEWPVRVSWPPGLVGRLRAFLAKWRRPRAVPKEEPAAARKAAWEWTAPYTDPVPKPVDPERRAKALQSPDAFLDAYFPAHRAAMARCRPCPCLIDHPEGESFVRGDLYLLAPVSLWATFSGEHQFVLLVGHDASHAAGVLSSIKADLTSNDPSLLDDFPEVCWPIRDVVGPIGTGRGELTQAHMWNPARVAWTRNQIVLPTIAGSAASGAIIQAGPNDPSYRLRENLRRSLVIQQAMGRRV